MTNSKKTKKRSARTSAAAQPNTSEHTNPNPTGLYPPVAMAPTCASLEDFNQRFPFLELRPLAEANKHFPQPDPMISLSYFQRFAKAVRGQTERPDKVLMEFFEKHSIEFDHSGWVLRAAGLVLLGYPNCDHERMKDARGFFDRYWRLARSPKNEKTEYLVHVISVYKSHHREHWVRAVRWMWKQPDWPFVEAQHISMKFDREHPRKCDCLPANTLQVICDVARRKPACHPAKVVLASLAKLHGVSERTLASQIFVTTAKKKRRKLHP
jgi:hypothetical protein